jgi:mannose-6-phosphate isomerase-like protein (cupin superfamily)
MAVTLEGGCRISAMREGASVTEGSLRIWNRIGRATGAQAISLRVMEFGPGLSPRIQNDDCDQILYVLNPSDGLERERPARIFATISIDAHAYDLGPDTGIYVRPHQTFAIDNPGPDAIIIISSQCPDPDRPLQFTTTEVVAPDSATDPAPLVRLADQKSQPTADRWYRVLVDEEIGSTQVTQFVGSIPPGRAPDHFHNYEEVLFILRGEGRMWAGETNTPIARGSCIYLPKGQVHCVENTGTGELRLLGVFYPAGSPSVRYDA